MSATATPVAARVDRAWMEQALAIAALGGSATRPNPRVGCVLVREGVHVGHGHHAVAGLAHAEAIALAEAGEAAAGATAYVTLEPCAHHGRTPPCAEMLVRAGVRRVVAPAQDPDPRVNGRGFARLRAAGVEVSTGVMADEAERLNAGFLRWHRTGRPLVTLKAAISLDGMLAARRGRSRWITGEAARRVAHGLRLRHDAVLVGAGTVRRDDPRLDVRLPGVRRSPMPVVLSRGLRIPARARVLGPSGGRPRARIYTTEGAAGRRVEQLGAHADVVRLPGEAASLAAVLDDLGACGVQSLLVEGGGRTAAAFLREGLVDEVALFVAPLLLGGTGGTPLLAGIGVDDPSRAWRLEHLRRIEIGDELLVVGRVAR